MQLYVVYAESLVDPVPLFVSDPMSQTKAISIAIDYLSRDDCLEVSISRFNPSDDD